MILSMSNNAGFHLVLEDGKDGRCALGHPSRDDQRQIMGNVVSFVVIPD